MEAILRKTIAVLLLSGGAALAGERPPLQSDLDRRTNAAQSNGRNSVMQGTIRLQMLIRPNGSPFAAFVWADHGIGDRTLQMCLSSVPLLWTDMAKSTVDYAWPYPVQFVPGGEQYVGGGVGSTTMQTAPSAFMPRLDEPPGYEPLDVAAAQATLDIREDATTAERGIAELAVHRYPVAINALRDALRSNSGDKLALRGLAQALAESGTDLKEAQATAKRLIE